jgi:hypothetical protein
MIWYCKDAILMIIYHRIAPLKVQFAYICTPSARVSSTKIKEPELVGLLLFTDK